MSEPIIFTRRQFLTRTAATGALVVAGGALGACASDEAEPTEPTSTPPSNSTAGPPDPELERIVHVAVHPAVGIARVGNSADSFFFGPDVPGTLPIAPDGFKDASGAIARQAARFRVYGYDAAGDVVRELTAADGAIAWTVSVANKKAAWYDFDTAMDVPIAKPVGRRNEEVTGADRDRLIVASGEQTIGGAGAEPVSLDEGRFLDERVPLGELFTDEHGRLVFLPAEGRGYSPDQVPLTTFSDNEGWVDDTCDGPVLATVTIGARVLEAEPGWVIVTPPNYGPGLTAGLVTGWDSARLGWSSEYDLVGDTTDQVRFTEHILPVFTRIVDMQWVNAGMLGSNGWGSGADYLDPALLDRLADPSATNAAFRQQVFGQFRDPDHATAQPEAMPQVYGDGMDVPAATPFQWLTVTPVQHAYLEAWANGGFTDDRDQEPLPVDLEDLPPLDQVRALDRAGLDSCLGGAYHPGIEVPWTLRVASMWSASERLRVRSTTVENVDYGDELTPEDAMADDGPLAGSGPGDLTRWQGVPWQCDAASCRSGYDPSVSPVLPTFWPARIPNHVLREADYRIVIDTDAPMAEREAAFERRFDWERFITSQAFEEGLENMMSGWADLGIVTEQPGPDDGAFPPMMKVETHVGFDSEPTVNYDAAGRAGNPQVWDGDADVPGAPDGPSGSTPSSTSGADR